VIKTLDAEFYKVICKLQVYFLMSPCVMCKLTLQEPISISTWVVCAAPQYFYEKKNNILYESNRELIESNQMSDVLINMLVI